MGVELSRLKSKSEKQLADLYQRLDPWQKTQVARHPERPRFRDYVAALVTDFIELSGDRKYGEDAAILGGTGKFMGRPVLVMGHEKGRTTSDRLKHNFGMARPEGYRKAVRLMDLAEKFSLPVVSFVDTAGAYPGIGAEERGQAEAIARSTERCLTLGVPMVAVIVGEGGSGGAIAIASGNKVLMLEHAIYSVISPERAASILWKDSARAKEAAIAMKITAQDLLGLKVIDSIIAEPLGGAHREPGAAMAAVGAAVAEALDALGTLNAAELRAQRRERFLAIGRFESENGAGLAP
jgi:acetyl-CoA carboxylase carboxyl transferase subunit alpha